MPPITCTPKSLPKAKLHAAAAHAFRQAGDQRWAGTPYPKHGEASVGLTIEWEGARGEGVEGRPPSRWAAVIVPGGDSTYVAALVAARE